MTDTRVQITMTAQWESPVRLSWPEEARVPVAGELLITDDGGEFRVRGVQWEQNDGAWEVQLRVVRQ